MEQLGARGKYGYYEAMDFTPRRMPDGRGHMVIRSFMAHHQGMSLLTLSNLLLPRTMVDRFHRNKEVRAAELLLQERIPNRPKWIKHPAMYRSSMREEKNVQDNGAAREFSTPHSRTPETCLLSNGRFMTMVTASGSGSSSWQGLSVSRWREEPVKDPWGSYVYIRDVTADRLWSPSYQPCRAESSEQRIRFELDKATFTRKDNDVETVMELCVSPETDAEVRRITLCNHGERTMVLEVTSFVELALSNPIADAAHTAFSKLFIRTSYDEGNGCLAAGRRKREARDRELWAAHTLAAEGPTLGPAEFETDRAAFIGRGYSLAEPQAIRTRLKGKTGSVADPAFVMRRRVQVEPGKQVRLYMLTSVADTKEKAVETVTRLTNAQAVERAFQLAWTRSRIELRNLGLDPAEALVFQRLAGQVLYTPPLRNERSLRIAANTKGQSGLWSYGISGDRPIVMAQIENRSQLPFILKLLTGHEYLRRLGLRFDLAILNLSAGGYQQDLQDALGRAVEHGVDRFGAGAGDAGIHVIPDNRLSDEDRTLLAAAARVVLRAGGPSLPGQLRLPRREESSAWPEPLQTAAERQGGSMAVTPSHAPAFEPKDLLFYNGWGGFTPDGKMYKLAIKDGKHLPAPWINVLANPVFGALVSELGTGYTFWRNSRECKLTPWSNDPVLDPPGEIGFLRDEASGEVWTMTPGSGKTASPYLVSHGRGFTSFEHEREGIRHTLTVFVPEDDPVKIMRLRIRNASSERRQLSVTYYAEWVIGVQRQSNGPFIVCEWDETASILTARNRYQETFREATAFLGIFPQHAEASGHNGDTSWTSDQLEFIGRNGSAERPAALARTRLSGRTGVHCASCGAIQRKLQLDAGEETEVIILLGCESSKEEAASLALKYSTASGCDAAWTEMSGFWDRTLDQIAVDTPSAEANILLNGWLLYQTLACRMWARTAFYQAGGAYGFRDQLQDSLALLHTAPELARKQIVLHASHQYEEGDVQHWWHEETERGIRTLFSDDLLWLPYSASRYAEHTGDGTVFDEEAPYLTSEPLKEGEHERYEETVHSGRSGTVYEHCLRAIDKSLQRIGEHGLPLIGVGDWNDGMNLVGDEGRGESVWLAWFLCDVLQRFERICGERGGTERAAGYRQSRERLEQAAQEHAWDGQWYRRAFTDAGTWLGTVHNEECRIDAIAQSWSVISGAAPPDRARQAMQSFDRELVDRELSVAKLLTPAFDRTEPSPGYIQGYPPGIRENGAQYTHGVIWSIVAWSKLGDGDKAYELFHMLNPITHTRTDQEVRQYVGEPYVMAADVYTSEPHRGHAGWTWYTGSSSWMYQSGIEWILGLQRRGSRLYLNPCVPSAWPGFQVNYRYGGTAYRLVFSRGPGGEDRLKAGPDTFIELADTGGERRIEIAL
jgi:cellobiose phosphorylase